MTNVHQLARGLEASTVQKPRVTIDELHRAFTVFFQTNGQDVRLDVSPKGLAHADLMVVNFSPKTGVGLRRLHADGVRYLALRRAPKKGELMRLISLLRTGPLAPEWLDDMGIALVDPHLGFLEVGLESSGRSRPVEEPELLASIPPKGQALSPLPETDVAAAFSQNIAKSVVRPSTHLPKAVIGLLDNCREEEATHLVKWLVASIFADLRDHRVADERAGLARLLSILAQTEMTERGQLVVDELVEKKISEHALRWLLGNEAEHQMALDTIRMLPEHRLPAMLADICELPRGKARRRGVAELMARGDRLLAVASQRMGELEGRTVVLLLSAVNHLPLETHSLSLYRAAAGHADPRVRARSLSWLAYFGQDYAVPQLQTALRSEAVEDRHAVLHLLRIARPELAEDTLRAYIRSPEFEGLSASEQKLVALYLVQLDPTFAKGTALAWLEAKRGVSEATQATAMTILAAVGDAECVEALQTRAKKLMGSFQKTAAREALAMMKKGAEAFDPEPQIIALLRQTGLLEHVLGSAPRELVAEEVPEAIEEEEEETEPVMSEEETREWLMSNMFDDLELPPMWTESDD